MVAETPKRTAPNTTTAPYLDPTWVIDIFDRHLPQVIIPTLSVISMQYQHMHSGVTLVGGGAILWGARIQVVPQRHAARGVTSHGQEPPGSDGKQKVARAGPPKCRHAPPSS